MVKFDKIKAKILNPDPRNNKCDEKVQKIVYNIKFKHHSLMFGLKPLPFHEIERNNKWLKYNRENYQVFVIFGISLDIWRCFLAHLKKRFVVSQ